MTIKPWAEALLKASLDGKTIQVKSTTLSGFNWNDLTAPGLFNNLARHFNRDEMPPHLRIKPDNVHRYIPVIRMPAGSLYTAEGKVSRESAETTPLELRHGDKLAAILHVEIDPETLALVSATMEKL